MRFILAILLLFASVGQITAQVRETLPVGKINKLLPTRVKGYQLKESKSDLLKFGSLKYTLCERVFSDGSKTVKILLFDYVQSSVMYTQAMSRWSRMPATDSDSIIFKPCDTDQYRGWESYTKKDSHAQLVMGVNDRFFLTLSGEKLTPEELRTVLALIPFDRFPK